ncbi:glycoside hydrolase family 97 protein [Natronoflexus pectinivorans]|uniref:Alpha-glucosidase n=1 Tax=Natronoflexus pectinivorans TaxID=682526 RepID=A0A4R2GMM8_9BACT|nr:glycoside hydrolase family 97 protein [Natronoflexus pectinivorans]TCO10532.1 alpha-glucosidase [Natronoflexus pectinivorans]
MKRLFFISLFVGLLLNACGDKDTATVSSPDRNVQVKFELVDGEPFYSVTYNGRKAIEPSAMGFILRDQAPLKDNFKIVDTRFSTQDEVWEQVWGEKQFIRDHHNELWIDLQEDGGEERIMSIVFRVFDNGVAFRYIIPEQENIGEFVIMDELTEFAMTGDHRAWWIGAYQEHRYEYLYEETPISRMDTVHTPVTFQTNDGMYISLHEAALVDYASYTVAPLGNNRLKTDLVPWADGTKVRTQSPMQTPWRTIQLAEKPGDLITNYMVLNLNEPNKLDDLSYIEPNKYMGIWWSLHIGKRTFWLGPIHGATTENAKYYIDFASKHGIPRLLIEGWNPGWTMEWYLDAMHEFVFTETVPGFDLTEVVNYGKERGVKIVGYHETGSNLINYLEQIDEGFQLYKDHGINDIKIGQVGTRLNMKEWHHGQFGVNYYAYVVQKAHEYQLAINFHEPIKPTGLRRTYPNIMTAEGIRGQEYNAWSEGNPPNHYTIFPFTRALAGPIDYTPGIFDVMIKYREGRRVHTTVAKQLALYVLVHSPIQMLADLPENYDGHPAFQFLLDVPVDWYDTQVIDAEIGEHITKVRRDRHSEEWYLGSVTNEKAREFNYQLSFLDKGRTYLAQIYADGEGADWETNPEPVAISEMEVDSNTIFNIKLAAGGGQAVRFVPLN